MRAASLHKPSAVLLACALIAAVLVATAQDDRQAEARAQALALIQEAAELLREVPVSLHRETVQSSLATALLRAAGAEQALAYAESLPDGRSRGLALLSIAGQQARVRDYAGALESTARITEPRIRLTALRSIAGIQAQRKEFAAAMATAAAIEAIGQSPHPAYNHIAFFQHQDGNAAGAATTLGRALAWDAGQPFDPADRRGVASRFSRLSEIASMQARVGDSAGAAVTARGMEELLAALPESLQKEQAKWNVARALVAAGNAPRARELAESIEDPATRGRVLAAIASQQAVSGDLPAARHAVGLIDEPGSQSLGRLFVAMPQAFAGDLVGAMDTAQAIPEPEQRAQALVTLAGQLARGNQPASALLALDRAIEAARQAEPRRVPLSFYGDVVAVQVSLGRVEAAKDAAEQISDVEARAQSVEMIATKQAMDGNAPGALAWARGMDSPLLRAAALLGAAEGILYRAASDSRRE